MLKVAVVVFPGSNCDHDLYHVYKHILGFDTEFIWHADQVLLDKFDLVALSGGFSYGDYLRAGAIASLSKIMRSVKRHVERGGYLIGICNGFQILTEAKLLPGALITNNSTRFVCRQVYLKRFNKDSFMTRSVPDTPIIAPIAHKEGLYIADERSLRELEETDRILFRYTDKDGNPVLSANPNGSLYNIAGILSENKKVAGMMPHPERSSESVLGSDSALCILRSLL